MIKKKKKCKEQGCNNTTYGTLCNYHKGKKAVARKKQRDTEKPKVVKVVVRKPKEVKEKATPRKKRLKRRSKSPYMKAKGKLWEVFSMFIRLRDSDSNGYCKCCSCNYVGYWRKSDKIENSGKIQAGHYIAAKKSLRTWVADERNINAQCNVCNLMNDGNLIPYTFFIEEKYGIGTAKELYALSNEHMSYKIFELEELTDIYKKKVEILKRKKNIVD